MLNCFFFFSSSSSLAFSFSSISFLTNPLILDYKIKLLDKGYQAYLENLQKEKDINKKKEKQTKEQTSTSGNSFAVFLGRRGEYF